MTRNTKRKPINGTAFQWDPKTEPPNWFILAVLRGDIRPTNLDEYLYPTTEQKSRIQVRTFKTVNAWQGCEPGNWIVEEDGMLSVHKPGDFQERFDVDRPLP